MLSLSPEYREKATTFTTEVAKGAPVPRALLYNYGKSLTNVQNDLRLFIRSEYFVAAFFDYRLEKVAPPQAAPVSPLESGLMLADLQGAIGKTDEARQACEILARAHPQAWEIEAALAHLARREGQRKRESDHYRQAVKKGCIDPQLYFDLALMLDAESDKERIALLEKAVELRPDFREARFRLGTLLLNAGNHEQALRHLELVKRVDEKEASRFFGAMAYAQLKLGQDQQARASAERALKYARGPAEKQSAEQLLRYLDARARPPERREPPQEEKPQPAPAEATPQTAPQPEAKPAEPTLPTVKGTLLAVDCLGREARLIVLAGGKKLSFLIADPDSVVIKGGGRGVVEFSCGPQKPRPIVIEYQPDAAARGTLGLVRSLEFQ
ncbi:MAG: tetratricopeptide repeat protein [Acidobacteriota bacterium]